MTSHRIDVFATSARPASRSRFLPDLLARVVAAIVRRRRNAAAADRLAELPPRMLADIGIDRRGIAEIRAYGVPAARWSVYGRRPLHRTTGVDIGAPGP